jgi:hypothetical protein
MRHTRPVEEAKRSRRLVAMEGNWWTRVRALVKAREHK